MSDKHDSPLRMDPPVRRADPALGERLALLARASTPTRVRHRAWRAPLAGLAIVVGTGGLAYGTQAVVHHQDGPAVVVPGADLSLTALPSSTDSTDRASSPVEPSPLEPGPLTPSPLVPGPTDAATPGGDHAGRGRSAAALTSAPGQLVRSEGPGAVEHPSRGRSDQPHGRPSEPGDPSAAAPGLGRHPKGTKPTTAANPGHPIRPTSHPTARPTKRPTARPSLPPTAQGAE